jgi:hypothetical protein
LVECCCCVCVQWCLSHQRWPGGGQKAAALVLEGVNKGGAPRPGRARAQRKRPPLRTSPARVPKRGVVGWFSHACGARCFTHTCRRFWPSVRGALGAAARLRRPLQKISRADAARALLGLGRGRLCVKGCRGASERKRAVTIKAAKPAARCGERGPLEGRRSVSKKEGGLE